MTKTHDTVECSVCGEEVGRMGIGKHAGVHKKEFEKAVGRPPEDYDEVKEWADGRVPGDASTLEDYKDQ